MMKRQFIAVFCALAAALAPLAAAEREAVVCGIVGPSGLGMVHLLETPPVLPGFRLKMEVVAGADMVAARLIRGEAVAGILPPNVAAKISASSPAASDGTPRVVIAAVVGEGMLALLSRNPALKSIADLRGKTVAAAGHGAVPEYVFRKILHYYGIEREVKLDFPLAYPEIAQSLIAGRLETALLPEPFATIARQGNPAIRDVADVQEEWARAVAADTGSPRAAANYPMTAFVVNGVFARDNPRAVAALLAAYRDSIDKVTANPSEAARLAEKHRLGFPTRAALAAIPRSAYCFIPAAQARDSLETLFRVLLDADPVSIGEKMPSQRFYYAAR